MQKIRIWDKKNLLDILKKKKNQSRINIVPNGGQESPLWEGKGLTFT